MIIRCPNCSTKFTVGNELIEENDELEFTCSRCDHDFTEYFGQEVPPEDFAPLSESIEDVSVEAASTEDSLLVSDQDEVRPEIFESEEKSEGQINMFPEIAFEPDDVEEEQVMILEEEEVREPEFFLGSETLVEEQIAPTIFESLPVNRRGEIAIEWPSGEASSVLKADLSKAPRRQPKTRYAQATQADYDRVQFFSQQAPLIDDIKQEPVEPLTFSFEKDSAIIPDAPGCLNFGSADEDDYEDDEPAAPKKLIRKSKPPQVNFGKVVPMLRKVLPLGLVLLLVASPFYFYGGASASKWVVTGPELASQVGVSDVRPSLVTLSDGAKVVQLDALIKNQTEFPFEQVALTARLFDRQNRPLGMYRLPALSNIANSKRVSLFQLGDIKNLQLESSKEVLRPQEERAVKIVVPHYDQSAEWLSLEVSGVSRKS